MDRTMIFYGANIGKSDTVWLAGSKSWRIKKITRIGGNGMRCAVIIDPCYFSAFFDAQSRWTEREISDTHGNT